METFLYKLKDRNGKTLFGFEHAQSIQDLKAKFRGSKYYLISAQPYHPQDLFKKSMDLEGNLLFTQRLSSLIEAGIPILSALNILWRQTDEKTMQLIIHHLRERLEEGETISSVMNQFPKIFSPLYVALIHVAEKTGELPAVLRVLGKYLQNLKELLTRIKKAAIYPCIVISFAILVLLGMFTFVVPVFHQVLLKLKVELPLLTRIIITIGYVLRSPWFILGVIGVVGSLYVIHRSLQSKPRYSYFIDGMKLKIFVIGPVYYLICLSRFIHALSVLFFAGVPVLESLEIAKTTLVNQRIAREVDDIKHQIEQGESVYQSFQSSKLFPAVFTEMIGVGESGGTLSKVLSNLAAYFDQEVDYRLNKLLTTFEPFLIIFVGSIVLITMLAIYLPILSIWKGLIRV